MGRRITIGRHHRVRIIHRLTTRIPRTLRTIRRRRRLLPIRNWSRSISSRSRICVRSRIRNGRRSSSNSRRTKLIWQRRPLTKRRSKQHSRSSISSTNSNSKNSRKNTTPRSRSSSSNSKWRKRLRQNLRRSQTRKINLPRRTSSLLLVSGLRAGHLPDGESPARFICEAGLAELSFAFDVKLAGHLA